MCSTWFICRHEAWVVHVSKMVLLATSTWAQVVCYPLVPIWGEGSLNKYLSYSKDRTWSDMEAGIQPSCLKTETAAGRDPLYFLQSDCIYFLLKPLPWLSSFRRRRRRNLIRLSTTPKGGSSRGGERPQTFWRHVRCHHLILHPPT